MKLKGHTDLTGRVDLTGMVFNRLTVVSLHSTGKKRRWFCVCECGKTSVVQTYNLKSNHTISCGCYAREIRKERLTTHGYRFHPLYEIWCGIKGRCLNENSQAYKHYGARGIIICKEWENNAGVFIKWCLENGWQKGLEIDRIDNDGIYEPENCRFVTTRINAFNKRSTVLIEYQGKKYTTLELETMSGISSDRILRRIRDRRWTVEMAITKPVRNNCTSL